jgi:hypothetical protein
MFLQTSLRYSPFTMGDRTDEIFAKAGRDDASVITLLLFRKQRPWKKFAVLFLVEPRALHVKELEARHAAGECKYVDGELRDRLVGGRPTYSLVCVLRSGDRPLSRRQADFIPPVQNLNLRQRG